MYTHTYCSTYVAQTSLHTFRFPCAAAAESAFNAVKETVSGRMSSGESLAVRKTTMIFRSVSFPQASRRGLSIIRGSGRRSSRTDAGVCMGTSLRAKRRHIKK